MLNISAGIAGQLASVLFAESFAPEPKQFPDSSKIGLAALDASWANREQQEVIEYLRTENAVLEEKLGTRESY